jgi:hypothetical protein
LDIFTNWIVIKYYTNIPCDCGQYTRLLNDKEFCFSLIGLNSIFSTLPQSEYTSCAGACRSCLKHHHFNAHIWKAPSPITLLIDKFKLEKSTWRIKIRSLSLGYIRACVYFCLLSIQCFNVVQPETRFPFQSTNQIAKKGQFFFLEFKIFKIFHKNVINFKIYKISKLSKISLYKNIFPLYLELHGYVILPSAVGVNTTHPCNSRYLGKILYNYWLLMRFNFKTFKNFIRFQNFHHISTFWYLNNLEK